MRRLLIERAGPVVIVKTQLWYKNHNDWLALSTSIVGDVDFIRLEGYEPMWITARHRGYCNDKDCENAIEVGDRAYIDGGRVLCEEHGKKIEETDGESKSSR